MTVLVTGGSGFVGLNLIEQLLQRGESVVNFSLGPPPEAARQRFAELPGTLSSVAGDVCDAPALGRALRQSGAARVVHAAVITAGAEREGHEAPRIVAVNIGGTVNVLDAAREQGVQRFVHLSSGAVYGENAFAAPTLDEATSPLPATLYAITKYAGERIALRYKAQWGLPVVAARLGAVFGRWEHDTGLRDTLSPPLLLTRMACAGREALLPDEGRRDWVYGPDVAAGVLALLDAPALRHGVYNVGAGAEWALVDWCERLRQRYPEFAFRVAGEGASNVGVPRSGARAPLAVGRLTADTGFRPRFGLDAAFADYMAWCAGTGLWAQDA